VNLIVDEFTERGDMAPEFLDESAFTGFEPEGAEVVYDLHKSTSSSA
jgi:hypothetical protein